MNSIKVLILIIAILVIMTVVVGILSNIVANWIQPHVNQHKRFVILLLISSIFCLFVVTSFLQVQSSNNIITSFVSTPTKDVQPTTSTDIRYTEVPISSTAPTNIVQPSPSAAPTHIALSPSSSPSPTTNSIPDTTPIPDAFIAVESLNMRSGPGIGYSRIDSYQNGTKIVVLGKNDTDSWLYVQTPDGREGWMSLKNLQVSVALSTIETLPSPPLPTEPPQAAVQVTDKPTQQPQTPIPLPTPEPSKVVLPDCGFSVDLGNIQSEKGHNLVGWGGAWSNQPQAPSGDTTFQYQSLRNESSLQLCVLDLNADYLLITEVQDFGCDDSFDIYINNNTYPIISFNGTKSNIIRTHSANVPASQITSRVTITFRNRSNDCGAAGVYNITLLRK